jgi:hypothetical protein
LAANLFTCLFFSLLMHNYLLTLVILLSVMVLNAQGTNRGHADDERLIRLAFREDFPGAENALWSRNEQGCEVGFVHNGYTMKVRYNWNSALVYQEFVVPAHRYSDLPIQNILQYLERYYAGYTLGTLYLCDAVLEEHYRAEFRHRNRTLVLLFDPDGRLLNE